VSHVFTFYNSCIFRTEDEETQHRSEIRNHSSSDATSASHDFSPSSSSPVSIVIAVEDNRVKLTDQRESEASALRMTTESEHDTATSNSATSPENSIQLPLRNIRFANNSRGRSIDSGIPFVCTGCAQTENPCSPLECSLFTAEQNENHE
jgi:hypothetical protein